MKKRFYLKVLIIIIMITVFFSSGGTKYLLEVSSVFYILIFSILLYIFTYKSFSWVSKIFILSGLSASAVWIHMLSGLCVFAVLLTVLTFYRYNTAVLKAIYTYTVLTVSLGITIWMLVKAFRSGPGMTAGIKAYVIVYLPVLYGLCFSVFTDVIEVLADDKIDGRKKNGLE